VGSTRGLDVVTPENLGELLDATVRRSPDGLAWSFFERGESLTFVELRDYVNRAANALRRLGVRHGTNVAILSSNRVAFAAAWLALGRLGAVAVPVNTRYTAREVSYVLEDAEVDFLVVEEDRLPLFASIAPRPARLDQSRVIVIGEAGATGPSGWDALLAAESIRFEPFEPVRRDDLVSIQYTSGTTGFPKGCTLSHGYWMISAKVVVDDLGFKLERALYNQNFFYMDGPFIATMCLFAGASFFVVSSPSASRFVEWIRRFRIQYCFFFEALYKVPESPSDGDNRLELVHTFGFNKRHHADLERRFAVKAREAYGMTEAGAILSMPIDAVHMVGSGSCGLPAVHREVAIMDELGRPVPRGDIGELWVRGPGLMQGYFKKPEANADVWRGDWLRTGDLFRQDERGYYHIVGRAKDMVRRNAENISCREVEEILRALPEIKESAVVPVPDERVGEEVKAYVMLQDGVERERATPEHIIAHCERYLAPFKIPRYIEYRESFPMTDSERVEKKKLVVESADLRLGSYDRVDGRWR
jgi:crotonobetaine/carnitine-CoA ligase